MIIDTDGSSFYKDGVKAAHYLLVYKPVPVAVTWYQVLLTGSTVSSNYAPNTVVFTLLLAEFTEQFQNPRHAAPRC